MDVDRTLVVVDAASAAALPEVGVGLGRAPTVVGGGARSAAADAARVCVVPLALPATRDGKFTLGKRGPATLLEAAVEYIRIASDAHGHDAQVRTRTQRSGGPAAL